MSTLGVKQADVLWNGRRMWVAARFVQIEGGAFTLQIALGNYRREYDFFAESKQLTGRARLTTERRARLGQ